VGFFQVDDVEFNGRGAQGDSMKTKIAIAPALFLVFLMTPIYWLCIMSLKTGDEIASSFIPYPRAPTLENFHLIFSESDWYYGYVNALIYVLMNVAISVTVAVPSAFAFSRYRFFGHRVLFFGLLVFRMMAPAILLVPFVQIFAEFNLIDTHVAVAIAHCFFNVPVAVWILEGFISGIPREMDESARIDGYSLPRYLRKIMLPQIAPGIAVTAVFCFMFSWVETLLANGLTVVQAKPINGILSRAGNELAADMPLLAAASVVGLVPGLLLIVLMKNYLARGFSMGRVA
jgi:glycerol transport system permease protein